jgi:GNAT superfamily N-acetyltransferase
MLRPIRLRPDSDPLLIETMRQIYVSALADFTKPLLPPTPAEQQAWWANLDHSKVKAFLWRLDDRPWEVVGFSMVRDHGPVASPIFALDPPYRGKGYAHQIIVHYIAVAGKPLRGEQLVANEAIRALNAQHGWTVLSSDGRVEKLYHPGIGSSIGYPDYDAILKGLDG